MQKIRTQQEKVESEKRFQLDMWGNWIAHYRNSLVDTNKHGLWELKDVYPREHEIEKQTTKEQNEEKLQRALQQWQNKS